MLLTSPLVTVPLRAVTSTAVDYFNGTATLARASWGRPSAESSNLDPTYRAFPSDGGCTLDWGSLALAGIRRASFVGLFRTFGPVRAAYLGRYPTPGDALKLVNTSNFEVDPEGWNARELQVREHSVRVGARWRDRIGSSPVRRIFVALSGDCAVFLIESASGQSISLVDLGGYGWFATFGSPPAGS